MVRDEVEEQPHPARGRRGGEPGEALLAAELGVEPPVINDVVAVHRPGRGGEDRREVEVGDAELGEVGDDRGGGVEAERVVELEPVGGGGAARHALAVGERVGDRRDERLDLLDVRRRPHAPLPRAAEAAAPGPRR